MIDLETLCRIAGADVVHALADDDRDGEADAAVIADAISGAAREVTAEVSRAGITSDPQLDESVADIVATLAVARLFERRRDPVPAAWILRATRARALAKAIGDGRHPLSRAASCVEPTRDERLFTRERLSGL